MTNHLSPRVLTVAAAATALLFTSLASAATYYVDFGPNDGPNANGEVTPSPASNGVYYNNVSNPNGNVNIIPPVTTSNLVSSTNAPSTIDVTASNFQVNGIQNGGLTNPNPALLGNFGLKTITEDYFYVADQTATVLLSDLDPTLTYDLSIFATRTTAQTRTTTYAVTDVNGLHTATLQTSGTGAGSAANPTGNDDDLASLAGLVPSAAGELTLSLARSAGDFGYIGGLQITSNVVPEPASLGLLGLGGLALLRRRR